MPASTDPESTFVAGAYECGVAVRDDGGWFLHGPSRASGTGCQLIHRPFDWAQGPDGDETAFFLCWMERVAD